jgi:hypothetical protein
MVEPCAEVVEWVELGVIGKNHSAATKPTGLTHDWPPVAEQLLKVASTGAVSTQNVARDALLRDCVRRDRSFDLGIELGCLVGHCWFFLVDFSISS